MKTFYVTTPIYYANSAPHTGSLYTTLVADTLARYKRQRGYETYFLTGTDEHGINIQRVATSRGLPPKLHVDEIVAEFKRVFADFKLDTEHGGYDIFMRTTNPFHYEGVSHLWRTVREAKTPKGNEPIYKGFYEGWFCPACAAYKTEDEYQKPTIEGEPPRCLIHLAPLDRVAEESYFFRLSDYGDALLALYEAQPELIQPDARRNEVTSFIRAGLQDLSISRPVASNAWGIPVPDDPSHTIYVWFDALTNYITAIGYGNEEQGGMTNFDKFWAGATHLVGNDILRFHTVYWHSFLLAASLPLPRVVFAHGMWLDGDGRKWSKTLGNAIYPDDLKPHFAPDLIRYFCLRQMTFGQDGRMSYEGIIDRANSDLASGLGNLASRTLTMIHRYCGGQIPAGDLGEADFLRAKRAGVQPDAQELASALALARDEYLRLFDAYNFSRALEVAWAHIARIDKFISDAKPWDLAKSEENKPVLDAVLQRSAESLRWLAILLHPVMPDATGKLWHQLGQTTDIAHTDPASLTWNGTQPNTRIPDTEAIFPRLDKKKIMSDIEHRKPAAETHANDPATDGASGTEAKAQATAPAANAQAPEGIASFITIDDFIKVEMRVGEILTAEPVPKSDKLLRFTVDLGEPEPRQILAGIAQHYEPDALIGRRVAVVSNLAPRKLRGFESQGMILAASFGEEGRPVLATFTEDVPNGARLK